MKIRRIHIVLLFICFTTFISCDNNRVFDEYKTIDGANWNKDSIYTFKFEIADTLSSHNILINSRITGQYPYSNMYLFVTTTFPDGKTMKDTLACILAEKSGRLLGKKQWTGRGFGDVWTNKIPYKFNIRFPVSGEYTIDIEQAMYDAILPKVLDIGVRVEKK